MVSRPLRLAVALAAACAAVTLPSRARACSVCQVGDPLFSREGAGSQPTESFSFYLDGQAFTKTSGVLPHDPDEPPDPGDREKSFQRDLTLYASWTPISKLTLTASLPFRWITIDEKHADGDTHTFDNHGFGDAALYLTAVLWRDLEHKPTTWLELRGMMKLPTGRSEKAVQGERDPHLQVGTGSWDFGLGLAGGHHFERWALYASAFYRINTEGSLDYEYGDALLANLIATHEALPVAGALFRPGVELNFRYAGHDQFGSDFYRSSGGSIVNVTPFLEVPFSSSAELRAPWLRLATRMPLGDGGLFGHQHESFTYLVGIGLPF